MKNHNSFRIKFYQLIKKISIKNNTSKSSKSNSPPFWIALLIGFSVAMIDNFIGFPIAVLIAVIAYYLCSQFNWSTSKTVE